MQIQRFNKLLIFIIWAGLYASSVYGQDADLVGIELARFPEGQDIGNVSEAGTRIQFFVKDTAVVTGLTTFYTLEKWVTNTGKDLLTEHQKLASATVHNNFRMARDTSLLSEHGFWYEQGKGFVFRFHSWALPDRATTSISMKGEIGYTVLVPGKPIIEDITHLAGNIDGLTGFEFMGNSIKLSQKTYGKGEEVYVTFNGAVTNKAYQTAIQTMQFLDKEGKVLDELFFGLNNSYSTRTRNRVDLRNTTIIRMLYRQLKIKMAVIDSVFGLGF